MDNKFKCFFCKRGKLVYVGNQIYECTLCLRGSFGIKKKHKKYKKE